MPEQPPNLTRFRWSEKWIAHATLILGAIAAVPVGYFHGRLWGAGIFIGAVLAWFNFRWLKQGMDAFSEAAKARASQKKIYVPIGTYFRALFRYLLIALAVYVIFKLIDAPVLSMILGLCALGAATFAVSVYEILHPPD